MPRAEWFARQAAALRAHPSVRDVDITAEAITVSVAGRTVMIDHDRDDSRRVALWTAVTPPAGITGDLIADACMAFTAEHALPTGCVMGYNEKAKLVAVGRSAYVSEFEARGGDGAPELLAIVLNAAHAGESALANARPAPPIMESEEFARMRQLVPAVPERNASGGLLGALSRIVRAPADAG